MKWYNRILDYLMGDSRKDLIELQNKFENDKLKYLERVREISNTEIEKLDSIKKGFQQFKVITNHLEKRDKILESIARVSINLLRGHSWEDNLHIVMEELGISTEVSRVFLNRYTKKENYYYITCVAEWAKDQKFEMKAALNDVNSKKIGISRWLEELEDGKIIHGNINEFPEEETVIQKEHGVNSVLLVPIFIDEKLWGGIGFWHTDKTKVWYPSEIATLKISSEVISAAIKTHETSKLLQKKERFLRTVIDDQVEQVCRFDKRYIINFVNQSFLDFYDMEGTAIGKNFFETSCHDIEYARTVIDLLSSLDRENPVKMITVKIYGGNPCRERWLQLVFRAIFNGEPEAYEYQCVSRDVTDTVELGKMLITDEGYESIVVGA